MVPVPVIPQAIPQVTFGERASGSEVLDVRICERSQGGPGVELAADGVWDVFVPGEPRQVLDLTEGAEFNDAGWRGAGAQLIRRLNTVIAGHPVRAKKHLVQVEVPSGAVAAQVRSFVIGVIVGGHTYRISNERSQPRVRNVHFTLAGSLAGAAKASRSRVLDKAVSAGVRLGAATCLSRDLANTPSNVKSPQWLARQAKSVIEGIDGVKVKLRDQQWLEDKGFGGILAVGRGSEHPPMLIELVWDPERVGIKRRSGTVVLVGKGVTFDTGGYSLKPSAGMQTMRTDMTGGASVIAAFRELATAQVPRKIVALVPTAENMISGGAYRPGDVVEHYGGITTEVTNTDAEGRMLLADALSYGGKKYRPTTLVSLATLTGAAKVALGLRTGAVFSEDWNTAVKLARRGAAVGENWWPMPQPAYLRAEVKSALADVSQTPKGPGAITAAMFLREFTRGIPLIHLDIAGPGRAESEYNEVTPLGTGFAARTLVQWLGR
ncbi:leucyl aminopeptidase family protein [Corynebacterium heidelbergense]|uniref:Probable cytosol aminopeptidase n=1 Tax=Corynebacterium heidelbergense TaxID=2055947 RepID=A0A364V6C8_9CORY|nr:M17 family metallopeptidase [Corynebacterium heidelbergense]RAV32179.1 peptidase M17 [Corynebacterium heidelbergense]